MAYDSLMVFTGNANPKLAADVVRRLNISLGRATVGPSISTSASATICPPRATSWTVCASGVSAGTSSRRRAT